ncbi:hypothetical protein [Burkholderia stagnalis]|uniref:hypothetical protein n=1 Tax=Burkholderia stagnalis TaxID=1503054 RepID=UPI000F572DE3|nr:hypothetical protein [Burkholderia stagnalis]RQQ46333.1 hypothetical protein DF145_22225 [Burkholderia stagnalis]RQX97242.1 hypothetical protein DF121_21395 [Burkholderia stagnalis]RQY11843.1 hypothetical protein DF115_23790 [Burkholderia stagnalis]RQY28197.1 hypothetical protein DF114_22725 [Burkholderia stagnalis]
MDHRTFVLCLASGLLATTTCIYGVKFLKKRNYLLGLEWLIVTVSSTNALIYFATGFEISGLVSHVLDAFSRGFGMPIVAVAGLMAVTHGYKPTARQDVALFAMSFAGTAVLVGAGFVAKVLPYFYVVMWALLSIYLAYFVRRLLRAGQLFHAMTTTVALVASQAIACIYDFYPIPGDAHNVVFNFFVLALLTWSYVTVVLYYAYGALERANRTASAGEIRSARDPHRRLA